MARAPCTARVDARSESTDVAYAASAWYADTLGRNLVAYAPKCATLGTPLVTVPAALS